MTQRRFSAVDQLLVQLDRSLRTLLPGQPAAGRASPATGQPEPTLNDSERRHSAGLMRVNHSGEVCAQALYQGQALTARLETVKQQMEAAAAEEVDHLAWCEQRLRELDSRPSLLNPLWYGLSFSLGALAGAVGDKVSLGFVAATEEQVCAHLDSHFSALPEADHKSRAVVQQMHADEAEHAATALAAGGLDFPAPVKRLMALVAQGMTRSSYHL